MPTLFPTSSISSVVLPALSSASLVNSGSHPLPFGVYADSEEFVSGAASQVAYTYHRLGGDVLDIELTEYDVFAHYEESCLEYSYLVNLHQAKNVLGSALGGATGSFDHLGELTAPSGSGSLTGSLVSASLKYVPYNFGYLSRTSKAFSEISFAGGDSRVYSASFDIQYGVQDYDLQALLEANTDFSGSIGGRKVLIKKIYYRVGRANWSLYGMYGGLNIVGNFLNYASFASDTVYDVMPSWETKLRIATLEDRMWNRIAHYSYELHNNKVRIYPVPTDMSPTKMWIEFIIPDAGAPWASEDEHNQQQIDGVNNINTLPFANIPYDKINSMGKAWIRNYALALSKETLGYVRGKLSQIPIPGGAVQLNGEALISAAKEEKEKLKEELMKILEETEYNSLSKKEAESGEDLAKTLQKIPTLIFVG